MNWRTFRVAAFFATAAILSTQAAAALTLYSASIRANAGGAPDAILCNLYTIDPANGAAKVIAPIRVNGVTPIAVMALAAHPITGVVYGITAGLATGIPRSLVTIDTATGDAEVIGALGVAASDVGFTKEGRLYAWLPELNRLGLVDLNTGAAKPMGPSGIEGLMGGGIAIRDNERAYVAATGATGTLDTVDTRTGVGTTGPALTGAPYLSAITNLAFSPSGTLYAVNSNMGAPASSALVTIDTKTGAVTLVGALPGDTHALIFANEPESSGFGGFTDHKALALAGLGVVALILIGWAVVARSRSHRHQ